MRKLISLVGLALSLWFVAYCVTPVLSVANLTIQVTIISVLLILSFAMPAYLDFVNQDSYSSENIRVVSVFVGMIMLTLLSMTSMFKEVILTGKMDANMVIIVMIAMLVIECLVGFISLIKVLKYNSQEPFFDDYTIEEDSEPRRKVKPQQLNQDDLIDNDYDNDNYQKPREIKDVKEVFNEAKNKTNKDNSYNINDLK